MPNKKEEDFAEIPKDDIPDWLNEKYFDDIVSKEYGPDAKHKIVSIKPVVAKGDNYVSSMYRVKLEIEKPKQKFTQLSLIVKASLDIPDLQEMGVFPKEMKMYEKIVKEFETYWSEIDGETIVFGPKCYKTSTEPTQTLVLADLKDLGYKMQDRHQGLDMEHAKVLLKKLAKFHSASIIYREKNGPFGDDCSSFFRPDLKEGYEGYLTTIIPHYVAELEKQEFAKEYLDKIKLWGDHAFDNLLKATNVEPGEFAVLNHGDTWVANYMYQHDDDGRPIDISLIDFQISYWASPAIDLYYFFVSSTNTELKSRFDELIQYYHTNLVDDLKKLKYTGKIISLKELHIDLLKRGFFAAFTTVNILPIVLLDTRDDADISTMLESGEKGNSLKQAMYSTPRYLKQLEIILKFLSQRGLLDVID